MRGILSTIASVRTLPPSLDRLLKLREEDGRGGLVPQLHQLQQHRPELCDRSIEQPLFDHQQAERPTLAGELALAARPAAALPPEVLEVGLSYIARPRPPAEGDLYECADVLLDVGDAVARILLQTVHRPQPRDLPVSNPSRHMEPPRSLDCMAAREYRGRARGRLLAVPICNIVGVERARTQSE